MSRVEEVVAQNPKYFKNPKAPTAAEWKKFFDDNPAIARELKGSLELQGGLVILVILFLAYQALK